MGALFRSDGWVKSAIGPAVPGAQIFVCTQPANVVPPVAVPNGPITGSFVPSPLASIFADPFGLVPIAQPIITDGFGHYDFYAAPNLYTVVVSNSGTIQQVYTDQSIGGFGTGSLSGNTTGLIAGNNITIIGNVISAVIPPPPSGGGVTGTGTAGNLSVWTSPTTIGNSILTDIAGTLFYPGNVSITGGITLFGTISTPNASSGPFDIVLQAGNATGGGSSKAANVVLDPGLQSTPSLTNNGRVSVRPNCAFYFGAVSFSQLAAPRGNPSSGAGAMVYCTDAKSAADGATWGSVAASGGSGALLRFTGSAWIVIG